MMIACSTHYTYVHVRNRQDRNSENDDNNYGIYDRTARGGKKSTKADVAVTARFWNPLP